MNAALGIRFATELLQARHVNQLDERRLRAVARERLGHVLAAAADTPFYAHRLALAGDQPSDPFTGLTRLSPVSKQELRQAGDTAFVGGRIDPAWYSSTSSGSTGEPFSVYYDARAWAILKYFVKLRSRIACGLQPWHRIALIDAIPPDAERCSTLARLGRIRKISVFRSADEIAGILTDFRPNVIHGLPSALTETVASIRRHRDPPRPKLLFTGGELLHESTRRELREFFGCPVLDVYGTSETKDVAWECRRGGLHINADVVHVEVLDDDDAPVPVGEEGNIVVTSLVNRAMPLIRYRTGDQGSLSADRCRCGLSLPLLGVVAGREADALEFANGRRLSAYALTTALEQIGGIRQYRVVQRGPFDLQVYAVSIDGVDPRVVEQQVRGALEAAVRVPDLTVAVEWCDRFESRPGAKRRVVEPFRGEQLARVGVERPTASGTSDRPKSARQRRPRDSTPREGP